MRQVAVARCLDKKLMLLGFEVFDVLVIFFVLSVLNFIFGQSSWKLILVWLPTLLLAGILRYGKLGKPDKFLMHWLRYQLKPGSYSAFLTPTNDVPLPKLKKGET